MDHGVVGIRVGLRASPRRLRKVLEDHGDFSLGSKLVCDATLKLDAGAFSLPPKEIMSKALDLWKEIGLPEFEIPRRAKLRIDRS